MNSLYRKYRPNDFSAVFGQEHITKTLQSQIKENLVGHAYLFTGVRGTGKTSVAKIFARAINCESTENKPCNKCEMCISILNNRSSNVIEIDAASNNGVDNIRDIKEEVKYSPTSGKYKVYIIDEVHMLSIGAFNAMLKTLEEPPSYVVFILATTDPAKVPATIHSRVLRFDFKRIKAEVLSSNIKAYAEKEGINITDEALLYIATLGDGSARDTLSILDTASSLDKELDITKVKEILGSIDSSLVEIISNSLIEKNVGEIIGQIEHINSLGKDYSNLILEIISHFRSLLVKSSVNDKEKAVDLIYCIEILIELLGTLKNEKYPRLFTEVYLIKIALRGDFEIKEKTNENSKERPKEKPQLNWREALSGASFPAEREEGLTDEEKKDILNKINTNIDWR